MKNCKILIEQLRDENNHEVADAIENLLADIEYRKTVAAGLVYLNDELAKANAEKAEKIRQLYAEIRQLNNENFWLCRG